ncbi:B12-binding domain-containing radical SAM protein [Streptomyces yaizuensis]|uniref:Radical SAM protein n=1 Tax=Streptomyces yaizuensis TaxID=2989713 RepID=A0ABQ5NXG5_9ACTN|nr:radical SAM protein [Streptomyces sp. YSPA8]GLF94914.1 radical SAM protein [Streptomyces sp. YSPA8]
MSSDEQADGGGPVDTLLIFPPQTEARFFPYLSLPYLAGHLRRRGRRVHQADLNIGLVHDVLRHPWTLADAVAARGVTGLAGWYQRALADVVIRHAGEVRAQVLKETAQARAQAQAQARAQARTQAAQAHAQAPAPAPHPPETAAPAGAFDALRLAGNAVELLVRDTFLARTWPDLGRLDTAVRAAATGPPAAHGIAVDRLHRLLAPLLTRHRPRTVGLSVAFFSQLGPALLIAAWVRSLSPGTRVCLGGQQVMLRHEDLAALPSVRASVDALCWTAGEEPLERWLDALDGDLPHADVPGMTWISPDGPAHRATRPVRLRFRDLGPPDFGDLPIHGYLSGTTQLALVSCVGCYWGRCAFCAYGNRSLAPGAYQQGTAEQIADAVEDVVRATGVELLAIADENTNLRLVARAMRLARERGIRVRFDVRGRLERSLTDPEFCRELADLGCAQIAVGYEGTSQRLLDLLDRGVRAADYQRILGNLADAGITVRLSVMGHVLDESPAEFEDSLTFLVANQERIGIDALELLVAEPGSRLARDPGRFGLALDTSGPLTGNPELNYLSGRVGYPMAVGGGPARAEALDRLERVFRTVTPGRAGRLAPPRTAPGAGPGATGPVRPYSWVRTVPADAGPTGAGAGAGGAADDRIVVADLVREEFYGLPRRDVEQRADGLLAARTPRGQRLLARLVAASAAEPCPEPRSGPDPEYQAVHQATPVEGDAAYMRRPS